MHIKKDDNGTWECFFYYKDYTGKRRQKHHRGFRTKKEAQTWAEEFLVQQAHNLDMTFRSFWEVYKDDMSLRLRENTMISKIYIVELKILPYFGEKKIQEITPADIRRWQGSLMSQSYKATYLKTINDQLSAIFNYAVRYYGLHRNPCSIAGAMGRGRSEEMEFWTQEEFEDFLECVKDKPVSYYAFKTLFWTGIRIGELLALTLKDVDLGAKTMSINKSYQRIRGKDIITDPKTAKGRRIITMPEFLVEDLREYFGRLYGIMSDDRIFATTKSYLEHEIIRGCELSGVKKIRLHDLRHSHATLLISKLGAQPKQVAERLGHEKIQTTLNTYSHLYPNQGRELADQLDKLVNSDINSQEEDLSNEKEGDDGAE